MNAKILNFRSPPRKRACASCRECGSHFMRHWPHHLLCSQCLMVAREAP